MRRTGWIVIAAFVAVPALMFATLWGCWRGGLFDTVPEGGKIEVSALFRHQNAIECSLASLHPGHDLVRYEVLPASQPDGQPVTAVIRVWQRPIVLGKRTGRRLQVKVELPAPDARVAIRLRDGTDSIVWPPPKGD